jgi:hypothetical protein
MRQALQVDEVDSAITSGLEKFQRISRFVSPLTPDISFANLKSRPSTLLIILYPPLTSSELIRLQSTFHEEVKRVAEVGLAISIT